MPTTVADGVIEIDTMLNGWERVTAGYLLTGDRPALVETGSQTSVPSVLEALDGLGLGRLDLASIVITHIHLDHAGGVGDIAAAFPNATVYVHPKGARHLADPEKLIDSAARVYGDLLDSLYGRLTPTAAERIVALDDGDVVEISSNRSITAVESPGHAKHHVAAHDSQSGLIFAGDAVGVRLPDVGILRPATPPPDFDLDLALASLATFADRAPAGIALAHYGLVPDPGETLDEAEHVLRKWAEVAERAWRAGDDIAAALEAAFAHETEGVDESQREKLETLNGIHSNAAGFQRWLDQRSTHAHPPHPHPHEHGHQHQHGTPSGTGTEPSGGADDSGPDTRR